MQITISSLVLALALTSGASAASTSFTGTPADVRAFCTGEGYFVMEGGNFVLCLTPVADIVCRSDNLCSSSDLELARAAGFKRGAMATL